jgi:hypothetical protein
MKIVREHINEGFKPVKFEFPLDIRRKGDSYIFSKDGLNLYYYSPKKSIYKLLGGITIDYSLGINVDSLEKAKELAYRDYRKRLSKNEGFKPIKYTKIDDFDIGDRVQLIKDINGYENSAAEVGNRGTVTDKQNHRVIVEWDFDPKVFFSYVNTFPEKPYASGGDARHRYADISYIKKIKE